MHAVPQSRFDIIALALPYGLGFGRSLPVERYESEDQIACGMVLREDDGSFGAQVMRRREDDVWTVTLRREGLADRAAAFALLEPALREGAPREPIPPGVQRRPALSDLAGVNPSNIFKLLGQRTHHVAAWLLNQVYLAMPKPDPNWVRDCQTQNFHTRLWEALLVACFREQGLSVSQDVPSPDFHIANRSGDEAWVEAVTANSVEPHDHYNAEPSSPPKDFSNVLLGETAARFAKTIRSKLQRRYHELPHVAGKVFAIAIADFHAPGSMIWSRPSLPSYLYGLDIHVDEKNGMRSATQHTTDRLKTEQPIPAGLFRSTEHEELSAIIFSNACSIGKFNRVAVSAGAVTPGLRYVRIGKLFDRNPGVLDGIPFCLDVVSDGYRRLWPQRYEPWSAELEVFHNPFTRHPWPNSLLREATHWRLIDGEVRCEAFYETSILWSRTLILDAEKPVPTVDQFSPDVEHRGQMG
mgnify:CR=1 FL=1